MFSLSSTLCTLKNRRSIAAATTTGKLPVRVRVEDVLRRVIIHGFQVVGLL